jgi:sortase A
MKLKSIILIVLGVLIAAYPLVKSTYTRYKQQELLNKWEEEMNRRKQAEANQRNADDTNDSARNMDGITEEPSDEALEAYLYLGDSYSQVESEDNESASNQNKKPIETIGVLKIDKINANLPIMEGTSSSVLKLGVGKLEGTSDFGEIGNTVLSAHRSHSYGQNFNRLNEATEGDIISITTMEAVYNYEVFSVFVVEPSDVSVLKKSKSESILTLITCHPLYIASHRLIVQARLLPE